MSKKVTALLIGTLAYVSAIPVWAANTNAGNQSAGASQQTAVSNQGTTQQLETQSQVQVQTQTVIAPTTGTQQQSRTTTQMQQVVGETGVEVQNQNQVQTQNQGEDQMLRVSTEEQMGTGESQQIGSEMQGKTRMLLVTVDAATGKIEEILGISMVEGSPGQQIQTLAQAQVEAQKAIKTQVGKVDARQGLVKSLIGPDYQALKTMTQLKEQNQVRIMELEQLQNQLVNQGDITMIQEVIQTLQDQNTALQDKINLEEQSPSLLGWLVKLFVQ